MGHTTIVPILDDNTINCTYYRDFMPTEDTSPVDLLVHVSHRYVNSANVTKEITLETFTVPKQYLETTGLAYLSDVEQTVEFNIINLRYLTNLFITINETRDGSPVVTSVAVNVGDDPTVEPLTDNPQKDRENDENIPEILPEIDISTPVREFSTVIYEATADTLDFIQISKRIYYQDEKFLLQEYNQREEKVFIENSIANGLLNPSFAATGNVPTNWTLLAPSMIVSTKVLASSPEGVNIWQLRITNPNLFSAFNTVMVALDTPVDLLAGINALNFSMYYRVKSTSNTAPFSNFNVRFRFFLDQTEMGFEQITVPRIPSQNSWKLLTATLQGSLINASANKVLIEIDIADIDTTDLFNLELILPQLETTPFATTRTLGTRIQDTYITEEFHLDIPFFLTFKTTHKLGSGIRGIFSSTTNLKDGFEIQVSSDRIFFKQYNVTGALIVNVASSPFTYVDGNLVTYGVWVDGTNLEFYLNNTLVSSHVASVTVDQTKQFIVGSLERANSAINNELLEFKILRDRL